MEGATDGTHEQIVHEAGHQGRGGDYSYVKIDTAPDAVHGPGAVVSARSSLR